VEGKFRRLLVLVEERLGAVRRTHGIDPVEQRPTLLDRTGSVVVDRGKHHRLTAHPVAVGVTHLRHRSSMAAGGARRVAGQRGDRRRQDLADHATM